MATLKLVFEILAAVCFLIDLLRSRFVNPQYPFRGEGIAAGLLLWELATLLKT